MAYMRRGSMMDIRQLGYFSEVARQASFSKASKKLHLSQPTLSKVIKNLEEELGVTLFDRSTRRMHLTHAGEILLHHANNLMKSMEALHAELTDLSQMKKGQVKLGLPPVIGVSFFPKIIAEFHSAHPMISIQLNEEGGKTIEQSLLDGGIDLGVVVLPVDHSLFEVLPIVDRRLYLVVPPNHFLTRRTEVHLSELNQEPFIMFREGFSLYDRVREACIREGFEPHIAYESSQWDFIGEMVAANQGIALLPETVCDKLNLNEVTVIRSLEPGIEWNLALIWAKNHYISHAAKGLIHFIHKKFPVDGRND
jgi:DNA-binding transcriptional LysR family regulator